MPHKEKETRGRVRGKDKQKERFEKNGQYSKKHIRCIENIKEKRREGNASTK